MPAYYNTNNDGQKVVELTSLWKDLTGKQGDRGLATTARYLGLAQSGGALFPHLAFPAQPGHAKKKLMPCADVALLKKLLSGLSSAVLEQKSAYIREVLVELGSSPAEARSVESKFAQVKITNDGGSLHIVKAEHSGGRPRFVVFAALKAFAPACTPSAVFYDNGVLKYLTKCGVAVPKDLADTLCSQRADANPPANPSSPSEGGGGSGRPGWDLGADEPTDYEKSIGKKSAGLVWGHSPYDQGARALHGDLPILYLILQKLQTKTARELKAQALHQGLYMMSGNQALANAVAEHWKQKRLSEPCNDFLRFLDVAVEHEMDSSAAAAGSEEEDPAITAKRKELELAEIETALKRQKAIQGEMDARSTRSRWRRCGRSTLLGSRRPRRSTPCRWQS